ncbi:MAG: YhfC family intramembrane metalloprotease, partial [Candidatus Heimdallarchaeota archaeon]|nr:YhfC family intramembrane metalloprotease [Candidatus Heimdallarchaeota archaeon]
MSIYYILVNVLIISLIAILTFFILTKSREKKIFGKVFFLGTLGWLVAFAVRIVPLQLVQLNFMELAGADLSDLDSLAEYQFEFSVMIWGPIFAGIFEAVTRYLFFRQSINCRRDTKLTPVIFGLGWGVGEAVIVMILLFVNNYFVDPNVEIPLLDLLPGLIERLSATILHISLSMIIFYAIYEKLPKISLFLGILLHFLFDSIIVVWYLVFPDLDKYTWIWSIEATLFVVALITLLYTLKLWRPKKEAQFKEVIDEKFKADMKYVELKLQFREKF